MTTDDAIDLSFVFPCLNEEETLGACIAEVRAALEPSGLTWEIVVADNGSEDGSRDCARAAGARVVPVSERGYGAALRGGIQASRGTCVAFADADGSYRLGDIVKLYDEARRSAADMVIARRLGGDIEPGAMPLLHRYLGTPVLTFLINLLFGGRVADCNSGFRLIRRRAFDQWDVHADGMEFASELLIKAMKHDSVIREVPSGLRRDRRSRPPHLRTWRDGMRHLLFILSERPQLFEYTGCALVLAATVLQVLAYSVGMIRVLGMNVFDYHSQALLIPLASAGIQLYVFSFFLYISPSDEKPMKVTKMCIDIGEGHLFFLLMFLFALQALGFTIIFAEWYKQDFAYLDMIRFILLMTHVICVVGFAAVGLLGIHVFRRRTGRAGS